MAEPKPYATGCHDLDEEIFRLRARAENAEQEAAALQRDHAELMTTCNELHHAVHELTAEVEKTEQENARLRKALAQCLRRHWAESAELERGDPNRVVTDSEAIHLRSLAHAMGMLKALGWQEMNLCPIGATVRFVVPGSTAVCPGVLLADGGCWLMEAGDLWPVRPLLWKPLLPDPKNNHKLEVQPLYAAAPKP